VKPFVSEQPDGKKGTIAIMADGSVRFIAENIPDDVFKAMCTIKGGEKVDLNKYTMLIPPPPNETAELETTPEPPPAPPKKEEKAPAKTPERKEPEKKDSDKPREKLGAASSSSNQIFKELSFSFSITGTPQESKEEKDNKDPAKQSGRIDPDSWKQFASKELGFSVTMPGKPAERKEKERSWIPFVAPGEFTTHTISIDLQPKGPKCVVKCIINPTPWTAQAIAQWLYGDIHDAEVASGLGKVRNDKVIKYEGHAGRDYQIVIPEKFLEQPTAPYHGTWQHRLLFIKGSQKRYHLTVGPLEKISSKDAERFLSSFKFISD